MKKLLLVVLVFFLASNVSRADWTPFETNFPWSLFDVSFFDDDNGFAVGEQGSILKTEDGAATWSVVLSVPGKWFNSVHFVTADVAYAVGTFGLVYKTIDGGASWTDQSIAGDDKHFRSVKALQSNVDDVIIVGYAGNMYKSINGGGFWTQDTSIPWTMHSVARNPSVIIIAATDGRIYRSANNGSTWSFIDIRGTLGVWELLNGVTFAGFGSIDAVIVGNLGRVLISHDQGLTWSIVNHGMTDQHLRDVEWRVATIIAVGDNGTMIRSNNDGVLWELVTTATTRHLYGISLTAGQKGYAVGEIGNGTSAAAYMTDNISVSVNPISSVVPDRFVLEQNYPNPYNPSTTIRFAIPQASVVNLSVYDISGKLIQELVNENLNAGTYSYTFDASAFTSGTYFYRLESNNFVDTKKMILVK